MKFNPDKTYSYVEAKSILKSRITEALDELLEAKNKIRRLEVKIEPLDALAWLCAQKNQSKIYWSSRDGAFCVAGVGLSYALHGTSIIDYDAIFTELERYLTAENKDLKFFGGMAFNRQSISAEWEAFGSYRFILPQFEIVTRGHQAFFACNLSSDAAKRDQFQNLFHDLEGLNEALKEGGNASADLPKILSRFDEPSRERWRKDAKRILADLENKALVKIVLARRSLFQLNTPPDPLVLLRRLKEISPECFHFCSAADEKTALIGASPERLYKREGQIISTEALAGTRPRGENADADERLKNELLTSHKEHEEHRYVIDFLKEALQRLCSTINADPNVGVLPLAGWHHLLTLLEGSLKKDVDDATILKNLHPTPAVCGVPFEKAAKTILGFEPFKRGWYAGPIGYVGYNTSEFAVAIRCGLLMGDKLSLFAGAGFVKGSDPQDEWEEIETKIGSFTKIFEEKITPNNKAIKTFFERGFTQI